MKIKTSELKDKALDWAVAKALGHNVTIFTVQEQEARWFEHVPAEKLEKERSDFARYIRDTLEPIICVVGDGGYKRRPTHEEAPMRWGAGIPEFQYSSNWAQGGPIIDQRRIFLTPGSENMWPSARTRATDGRDTGWINGETTLIAAMRCFVISELGDEVDIPEELL